MASTARLGGVGGYDIQYDEMGNVISSTPVYSTATTIVEDVAENKTPTDTVPVLVRASNKNVLSKLRSYTYNFTLACLSRAQSGDPSSYVNSSQLDRVILKSGGKLPEMQFGSPTMGTDLAAIGTLMADFNKYSAGRYNMYIENFEMDSVMTFTQEANATQPTNIKFDVIEPYSVHGFLEALSVAAAAGGWESYMHATFVILIEFYGFSDSDSVESSVPIKLKEKRYIPFNFSKMDVEITEKGTGYKCEAVPYNERGFGTDGRLPSPMPAEGKKVGDILRDLVNNLNLQLTKDKEKDYKAGDPRAAKHPMYYVRFDSWSPTTGFVKGGGNLIETSDLLEDDKHARNFSFQDPQQVPAGSNKQNYPGAQPIAGTTATTTTKATYEANNAAKTKITFEAGANLFDIISNTVANSKYVRDIVLDLYENKGALKAFADKKAGMVNYFLVKLETEENTALGYDEVNNIPLKKYTYVISPFQIHFTRIPDFAKAGINMEDLETRSIRSYNYIYTGENQEILNFKLQYNYLYFEGVPQGKGSTDSPTQTNRENPSNNTTPKTGKVTIAPGTNKNSDGGIAPTKPNPTSTIDNNVSNGILRQEDPYFALANNLHKAVTDSKTSMVTAEVEILGDPFFLLTGGLGNQLETPDPSAKQTTQSGQADYLTGDCIIDIKFRTPDDISTSGPDQGFVAYNKVISDPFHGAYRVTKVLNTFKDGLFKQRLDLIRVPGQDPQNKHTGPLLSNVGYSGEANPYGIITKDARNTADAALAPSGASLLALTGRGIPTINSNFVGAAGGLGSFIPGQAYGGITNGVGKITAGAAVFGGAIPGGLDQTTPIRLTPESLLGKAQGTVSIAEGAIAAAQGLVSSAENFSVKNILPSYISDPSLILSGIGSLASSVVGSAINQLKTLEGTVENNINLAKSVKDGMVLTYSNNFINAPAYQTKVVDSTKLKLSADEQQIVATSGLEALAKSRGVQVSELPNDLVNDANRVTAESKSALGLIKEALGSAQAAVNTVQSTANQVNNLATVTKNTAVAATSPLSNLMNRNV